MVLVVCAYLMNETELQMMCFITSQLHVRISCPYPLPSVPCLEALCVASYTNRLECAAPSLLCSHFLCSLSQAVLWQLCPAMD